MGFTIPPREAIAFGQDLNDDRRRNQAVQRVKDIMPAYALITELYPGKPTAVIVGGFDPKGPSRDEQVGEVYDGEPFELHMLTPEQLRQHKNDSVRQLRYDSRLMVTSGNSLDLLK